MRKNKLRLSLSAAIIGTTLLTCLFVGVGCICVSMKYQKNTYNSEVEQKLKAITKEISEKYDFIDDGSFAVKDSAFYKGNTKLTDNNNEIDALKEESGIYTTIFFGDTIQLTSIRDEKGNPIIGTKCTDDVKKEVLDKGNNYYVKNTNIQGKNYHGYYRPINGKNGIEGIIFAGQLSSEIDDKVKSLYKNLIMNMIICISISLIYGIMIGRFIKKKVRDLEGTIDTIADGDFSTDIVNNHKISEFSLICNNLINLQKRIGNTVSEINSLANTVNDEAQEVENEIEEFFNVTNGIMESVEQIAMSGTEMANNTEHTMKNINSIASEIATTTELTQSSITVVNETNNITERSKKELQSLISANLETRQSAINVSEGIFEISRIISNIKSATNMITEIASHTSLLALNASIEAARAGEAGKGFSVVASEIQSLSEQSQESAEEINKIIESIVYMAENNVSLANIIKTSVAEEGTILENVNSSFDKVSDSLSRVNDEVNQVTRKIDEINKNKEDIISVTQNLTAISEENAASTEETSSATQLLNNKIKHIHESSRELKDLSNNLKKCINKFKIK